MRLAALYCVWGDVELLEKSINNIRPLVDGVIVTYSIRSNYDEPGGSLDEFLMSYEDMGIFGIHREADQNLPPSQNERNRRNEALNHARRLGFTHFIMLDADEFYDRSEFLKEKERFKNPDLLGTVCRTKVYFKDPCLTIGYDTTLVPFIHKITPDLKFQWNPKYPFAFEGPKREIRIDPTRQMNISSGVEWSEITMHHMSYLRPDIHKKIRNSTARANIENSTLVTDFNLAKEGYFCSFYGKQLEPCSDLFSLCTLPFIQEQRRGSKTSFTDSPPAQGKKT